MKKYFQAPWSIKDLITTSITAIILGVITIFTLRSFGGLQEAFENSSQKSLFLLVGIVLQWLIISIPIVLVTIKKYGFKWKDFGFNKIGFFKLISTVLSGYLVYFAVSILLVVILLTNNIQIPGYQLQPSLAPEFGDSLVNIVFGALTIAIIAPILEEIIFRGYFLQTLVNKIGSFWGSIATATIFSLIHYPWQSFIPIFILGLIMNSLVIKTKSIWPAIVFHITNNAWVFALQILIENGVIQIETLT